MIDKIPKILSLLPYDEPFLFVEYITELTENNIKGSYTVKKDEYYFRGHFREKPVVPGVIITEIMAQIGLVSFGIGLLLNDKKHNDSDVNKSILPVFSNFNVEFVSTVGPGDVLLVDSKKVFFRMGKLFCKVKCSCNGEVVARGELGGVLIR
ncbi:MAG: hydroxymyristoyl-ACP dehydratase [Cyclobacteriaceae bacterium]